MTGRLFWKLLHLTRQLWVRVTLMALLAIATATLSALIEPAVPEALAERLGRDAVAPVLSILASSMLAVTTFSLGVMVTAQHSAAGKVTPRAHRVMLEDTTTQSVLATFLGAFLFALVALILLRAGFYDGRGPVIAFFATLAVIALVVVAMLRWIDHLSDLGSLDSVLRTIDSRTDGCLAGLRAHPGLGTAPWDDAAAGAARWEVAAPVSGSVQFIDTAALSSSAERLDLDIHIVARPGDFLVEGETLARLAGPPGDEAEDIAAAFRLGDVRTFDQDGRYGLVLLSEIASRALSPGVNDPGTAIAVLNRLGKLLCRHAPEVSAADPEHPRLHARRTTAAELLGDAFAPIARDGAGLIEVVTRLLAILERIREAGHRSGDTALVDGATAMRALAIAHAEHALPLERERAAVRDARG